MTEQHAMTAEEKILKARHWVVMNRAFFGALAMRLKITNQNFGHPTIWTDGKVLAYNEEFIQSRTFDDLTFIITHEVMHCALGHPYRHGKRDMKTWNTACDHAVNLILSKEKDLTLPADATCDAVYTNQSAEQIYEQLYHAPAKETDKKESSDGKSSGKGKKANAGAGGSNGEAGSAGEQAAQDSLGSPHGDVLPAGTSGGGEDKPEPSTEASAGIPEQKSLPGNNQSAEQQPDAAADQSPPPCNPLSEAELKAEQEDWEAAVTSAALQAEAQGHLSGNAIRALREGMRKPLSYGEYMRLFAQKVMRSEESWSRPSRRSEGAGVYLPIARTVRTGVLVIGVDTSGSISSEQLSDFERELKALSEDLKPEKMIVIYCDARVQRVEELLEFEEPKFERPKGGGGTKFAPVFKYAQELIDEEGEEVVGLIYLTDLLGEFPKKEPEIPTLWVSVQQWGDDAPFGETVRMQVAS